MRIGIYADINTKKPSGVSQYIEKFTLALIEESEHHVCIITNVDYFNKYFSQFKKNPNVSFLITTKFNYFFGRIFYNKYSRSFTEIFFNKLNFISYLSKYIGNVKPLIYDLKLDVIHFPFQCFPMYHWNIPTLITLHDLQQEYYPDFFNEKQLKFRNKHYKKSAVECDHILVSFEHVKEDIVKFYNIPIEKITVTCFGTENRFKHIDIIKKDDLFNKFNIKNNFIFYPAQTWKHKNHIKLLDALVILRDKYKRKIYLICTGNIDDNFKNIKEHIDKKELKEQVLFLGFVSMAELYSLYIYSDLVVIPTLYEAGSFPLLEAMTLKRPVICSKVTSLPETIGDNRFVFNPNNEEEMAKMILDMLENKELRSLNIENSKKQVKRFNWGDIINNFIYGYQKAIDNFKEKRR
jgi:glycosyltransferase involved in cell wall biosynthesis